MIELEELAALLDTHDLTRVEFEQGGTRVVLERQQQINVTQPAYPFAPQPQEVPAVASSPAATTATAATPAAAPTGTKVTAPLVGAIYTSPEPGAAPFVTLGQQVNEGDTLCLIEAMKTFNEIPAPVSGIVREIKAEDGALAEFGMHLFTIG
jgi:acetyl-CoA carboxylase biotin carboxyl carrier protein